MKNRIAVLILLVMALSAIAWGLLGCGSTESTQLVPAWQIFEKSRYWGMQQIDPFVSWSPDSKSLLTSEPSYISNRQLLMKWNVGEKKLQLVTNGVSPNYINDHEFIYLKDYPKSILKRDLITGKETEIIPSIKTCDVWREVTAFTYDPQRKSIVLRMVTIRRYNFPGTEEYALSGKRLGSRDTRQSEGVMDYSYNPDKSKCVLLVAQQGNVLNLEIANGDSSRGKTVASGELGAVAWSPNGKTVAYSKGVEVLAVRPGNGKPVVVGRFGDTANSMDERFVCRLSWSPNSKYLAALVYVPDEQRDYPMLYVLDMSKFKG